MQALAAANAPTLPEKRGNYMKRCPQCNRSYTDDALSFCLDDGTPLISASAPTSFDPSATVQYPQSRETSPQPTIAYTPGQPQQAPLPPPSQPPWSPMPPRSEEHTSELQSLTNH